MHAPPLSRKVVLAIHIKDTLPVRASVGRYLQSVDTFVTEYSIQHRRHHTAREQYARGYITGYGTAIYSRPLAQLKAATALRRLQVYGCRLLIFRYRDDRL